ncbi:MBOAT family protein [Methylomonas sp. SURF-2]|uniref:Probable alginate O-acetylase n=1 Tax=Methylomonas subterranea TaxID=2952225 RepID=A0ABT1TFG6_9GAMM|nr:MBOAT family O-acyltransferase [Methylomonas sp. SURF-2]MCQ8104195.1 MBOAT family protein [Methylomonas sp. SURF-2]
MLFNSYLFVFAFLPITLALFFIIALKSHRYALYWLAAASLVFYATWNPAYSILLITSITFNFIVGKHIAILNKTNAERAKHLTVLGVGANVILLVYYKYLEFIIDNLNTLFNFNIQNSHIVLPLGISFFTFTQIAFLVDTHQKSAKEFNASHYALFVTYFPHLIAGPILHHKEMMTQFADPKIYKPNWRNMSVGLSIFFMGLFKKLIIADDMAGYVKPVFDEVASGKSVSFLDAWGGALAYTFQLYFDFSAYSEMAIGLSLLFGIKLPLNFASPYKATSIIEFWRRWHMTLSRFLKDYIYIPLGGNRKGRFRRHFNLILTMLVGGIWHGANWTFILWGGLHGGYLLINHLWRDIRSKLPMPFLFNNIIYDKISLLVTFSAVVVGWTIFRADNVMAAKLMLEGMTGMHGLQIPVKWGEQLGQTREWLITRGARFENTATFNSGKLPIRLLLCFVIAWCLPNVQEFFSRFNPALYMQAQEDFRWWHWRPNYIWLIIFSILAASGILSLGELSEFIYFQF